VPSPFVANGDGNKRIGREFPVASQSRSPNNLERCWHNDTPFALPTAVEKGAREGPNVERQSDTNP
jgi:hypothetical protein